MDNRKYQNTALALYPNYAACSPKKIFKLKPSMNSAFEVCRKRKRSGFRDLVRQSLKKAKFEENSDSYCDINTSFSVSSLTSFASFESWNKEESPKVIEEEQAQLKKRDEKEKSKTGDFHTYNRLNIKERSKFYQQNLKDMNQKKCIRGRKRTNVVKKAKNLSELIEILVIPEWEEYLVEKRNKENMARNKQVRSDAVWKKIMRDWREFYRILFKNRFHRMDYQEKDEKVAWIRTLILELGFPNFSDDTLIYSYNFFHQIHLSEKNKAKYQQILPEVSTGFDALNWYTNKTRTQFLQDGFCSRLLYFLYRNFQETYYSLLSSSIKEKVKECIEHILTTYEGIQSDNDAICTSSLPI